MASPALLHTYAPTEPLTINRSSDNSLCDSWLPSWLLRCASKCIGTFFSQIDASEPTPAVNLMSEVAEQVPATSSSKRALCITAGTFGMGKFWVRFLLLLDFLLCTSRNSFFSLWVFSLQQTFLSLGYALMYKSLMMIFLLLQIARYAATNNSPVCRPSGIVSSFNQHTRDAQ